MTKKIAHKAVSIKIKQAPDELVEFARGAAINGLPASIKALVQAFADNRVGELVMVEPEAALVDKLNKHFSGD